MKNGVMLVDDSRAAYEMLNRLLENTAFEIVAFCKSGEAALSKYGEVSPDIVIMDILMPGMNGLETSAELKRRWPEAKILIASSLDYGDIEAAAESIGCVGVYQKPFERSSFLKALQDAVSGDSLV